MRAFVRCEHCGTRVGELVQVSYSETSPLYDKLDYNFEPFSNFGKDTDSGCLCLECAERVSTQAMLDEEAYQEDAGESEEDIVRYAQEEQTYAILPGGILQKA